MLFLLTQSEKQGNYFVGRHGQTPKIDKIKTEDDYVEINEEYEKLNPQRCTLRKSQYIIPSR